MSLWRDKKYVNLLAAQLPRFRWKSSTIANCRCVLCGDSAKSQLKARGYFFPHKQSYLYKCHDCGVSIPLAAFLYRVSRQLHHEYVMEKWKDDAPEVVPASTPSQTVFTPSRVFTQPKEMEQLSASVLSPELIAVREFVEHRQIPASALKYLYGTTHAHTFLQPLVGDAKAAAVKDGLSYLVIPLCLPNGTWYGAQFRLLTRKEYLTFRWGHDRLRVFGLQYCNLTQPVYCVEGPLDALCLPNALAMCGSDLQGGVDALRAEGLEPKRYVLVWDNEPRNTSVRALITKAVHKGEPVVIWPPALPKDVNEMVQHGIDAIALIRAHTYQGIRAELELQQWQK